ncbi:MAG: radical SAM protein, partial [Gemmatimonadota bacterium]
MRDGLGRTIDYLRISVIDKCNLRCTYCMPVEGFEWIPRAELLTYEEITAVVREMVDMGLRRVRITGGEPLIRQDLHILVRMLREVEGLEEISLSTNGILLPRFATELRLAGLDRINISVDT